MIITFDTETTALQPGQICQLSYIMYEKGEVTGKNLFFSVDEMSEGSEAVHGFSMEMLDELSGGERFEDKAEEVFADFSQAKMLIGHNVIFDDNFLRTEFTRAGMTLPRIKLFDTMNYFTPIMLMAPVQRNTRCKPPKLIELAAYLGLTDEEIQQNADVWFGGGAAAHDARFDAAMTFLCLKRATEKGMLRGVL